MSDSEIIIIAPDPDKHGDELCDLFGKTFEGYWNNLTRARDSYIFNGFYDWKASRISIVDGVIASHYGVWKHHIRIGRAKVLCGGVGAVATHNDYRGRGLLSKTARASVEAMKENGYDLSVLFGIRNFYHKFGYVRAWAPTSYTLDISDLPESKPGFKFQIIKPAPDRDAVTLYNKCNAGLTGTAVRPTYLRPHIPDMKWYGWFDSRRKLEGYVVVGRSGEKLRCIEYAGNAEKALQVLAELMRQMCCCKLHFVTLHYGSKLCSLIRSMNSHGETTYEACGGPMARITNLRAILQKLCPELSARVKNSLARNWNGDLLLDSGEERAVIEIRDGKVSLADKKTSKHSIKAGASLTQLIVGTDTPENIINWGKVRMAGDAKLLVDILFPDQHPAISAYDGY